MKNIKKINQKSGQAMLTAVIFFLIISTTVVLGIATPILKHIKISNDLINAKESYFLAEGGLEDALYRVKSGMDVASSETLIVNGYTTTITITTTASGKTIDTASNRGNLIRKMQAKVETGVGAAFNYGVQVGNGGFILSGGSQVIGNIYANGSIISTNGEMIKGSAIAANSVSLTSDQSNTSPTPISTCTFGTNCLKFRETSTNQDIAQSFKVSALLPVHSVKFYIKKVGTPSDGAVRIVTNLAGKPSTTNLLSSNGTLAAAQVSTTFGWVTVTFPSNPSLDPDETYWLVIDNGTQNSNNYYIIGANANTAYVNGTSAIGKYNGTWATTNPAVDAYFDLYMGGLTSYIGGGTYVGATKTGTVSTDITWAHRVSGDQVTGSLYCQTAGSTNNSKPCDTSRADPPPVGFPLSDAMIDDWKDEATTTPGGWTYNGNLTIGYQGTTTATLKKVVGNLTINGGGTATFGELEVTGNVTINGGGTLIAGPLAVGGNMSVGSTAYTMKGTTWVKGTFTVSSGGTVRLASSYSTKSGVIVVDGWVDIQGGSNFAGSGQTGSYPLVVTTSNCPNGPSCTGGHFAVNLTSGSGAVVINAQQGTILMAGGTNVKSLTAEKVIMSGGASVTYDSGLADMNFSSGPSGGYNVTSWKEVQ